MASRVAGTRRPDIDVAHRDLVETSARFANAFLRWLADTPEGLTYPRLRMLEVLHCHGPAKMKDLADSLGLTARNLTTLADGLETDGLVRRVSHPNDRRSTLLELTASGMAAAECSLAPRLAEISCLFDELSATQRSQLQRSLTTLVAAMEADQPIPPVASGR
ncbi:MAG: MarR family transcriptional regulator [Acidimicrobiaceae bacterium]|nr:MarR family transcriptional regulator [Acidimicrobiaceae bacterium]